MLHIISLSLLFTASVLAVPAQDCEYIFGAIKKCNDISDPASPGTSGYAWCDHGTAGDGFCEGQGKCESSFLFFFFLVGEEWGKWEGGKTEHRWRGNTDAVAGI